MSNVALIPKRFKIAFDIDDTIAMLNAYAIDKCINPKYNTSFDVKNIKSFDFDDGSLKYRQELYNDPDFIRTLPPYPGAVDCVQKLRQKYDVYFVTAVYPPCMSARIAWIKEYFPDFPDDHILIGAAKNLVQVDFLLDDRSENIQNSIAKYPVLFRQPWNEDLSGVLSVTSYDDFIHIVESITGSYNEELDLSSGGVICLIGPSGSGKTAVMRELTNSNPNFIKSITTTTRTRRTGESSKDYNFVSKNSFLADLADGKFLETTVYGGNYYGTKASDINSIIDTGNYAVIPIDICGGISLKNTYKNKCILIFIERNKASVVETIINRDVTNSEKIKRIVSLDWEYKNKIFCDAVIENNSTVKSASRAIKKLVKGGPLN